MSTSTTALPHQDRIIKGMMFGIAAFFVLALMNMFGKLLSTHHHVIEIAFYRNIVAVGPLLIYFILTKKTAQLRMTKKKAMFFRALNGTIGLVTTFAAYSKLPMADATVLLFTASLMVPALSYFFLKEYVGPYRWTAVGVGLLGIIIMADPSGDMNMLGVGLALLAALFHASAGIMMRYLKTEPPLAVTFYFILCGAILCGLAMPFIASPLIGNDIWLILGIGATGSLAQLLLTSAYKYAPPAAIAPFNYLGLIWATGIDILIWHYVPEMSVFVGAGIVIACNLFIIYREHKNARAKEITAEALIQSIEK